jgi:hypothetical protein
MTASMEVHVTHRAPGSERNNSICGAKFSVRFAVQDDEAAEELQRALDLHLAQCYVPLSMATAGYKQPLPETGEYKQPLQEHPAPLTAAASSPVAYNNDGAERVTAAVADMAAYDRSTCSDGADVDQSGDADGAKASGYSPPRQESPADGNRPTTTSAGAGGWAEKQMNKMHDNSARDNSATFAREMRIAARRAADQRRGSAR